MSKKSTYELTRGEIYRGTTTFLTHYDWEIQFTNAPSIFLEGEMGATNLIDTILNEALKCKTIGWSAIDIPDNEPMQVNIRGHRFSQVGMTANYGAVTIQAMDDASLSLTKYLVALAKAEDDPDTHSTRGLNPGDLHFDFNIYRLNPQGQKVLRWKCEHCLLTNKQFDSTGTSEKSIAQQLSLVFMVDFFKIEFPKDPNSNSVADIDWS